MNDTPLLETVERLQLALEAAGAGLFDRDLQTGSIACSPQLCQLLGVAPGTNLTDAMFRACVHPDDRARLDAALRESIEHRTEMAVEHRLLGLDGSVRWVSSRGRPFYDDHGVATRLIGITFDVTAQLDARDLLQRHVIARLATLGELLPTLAGVLDIRTVFERVSAIAQSVIAHDLLSLPLLTEDKNSIIVYAVTGDASRFPETVPLPEHHRPLVTSTWSHLIYRDIQEDPLERVSPPGQAGYRARLLVPVRLHGETLGALDFLSMQPGVYVASDALLARCIADHVALALSHQRLADQARRSEQLRAREARLEILDELLASVTDTGDLKEQFDRISEIARKVLPHDALVLPVVLPDGVHAQAYAYSGLGPEVQPEVVRIPDSVIRGDRDYELIDDLAASPERFDQGGAALGFCSALRVTIRLDGRLAAGLSFVSRTRAAFTPADVLVARRIADRIALALSRELRAQATSRAEQAQELAGALERRVRSLAAELNAVTGYSWVVGECENWTSALKQATQVAATDTTVLLLGESGTGKEVVARFIHRASKRSGGPFVALNCAALPEPLLESELFGFERGAFTGATQAKPGQLERAGGGVLFLDEVGDMSLAAQAKFLRVLQEREFQRLGGTRTLQANVRVIAATNRDLWAAIARGTFREDLYYRLHVFAIHLPPLRQRQDDILPLSEAFLGEIAKGLGRPPAGISREARAALVRYHWPGNVRELRNMLERAAILCEGGLITTEHLTFLAPHPTEHIAPGPIDGHATAPLRSDATNLRSLERAAIERALHEARQNKSHAARLLGLSRKQLYLRLRQHGLR